MLKKKPTTSKTNGSPWKLAVRNWNDSTVPLFVLYDNNILKFTYSHHRIKCFTFRLKK